VRRAGPGWPSAAHRQAQAVRAFFNPVQVGRIAGEPMNNHPVVWFEIQVQDLERAKTFYQNVFQTELTNLGDSSMAYWTFATEPNQMGAGGALVQAADRPAAGNSVTVYFACDDCAVEEARWKDAGGRIQQAKMSIGEHGFISLAYDTEGNLIGLHSMR
jgi:predicted enzyme related to lactoylglutathione lyase